MAAHAPTPSSPLDFATTGAVLRLQPPVILPSRTIGARIRSLLANRGRFAQSLARESASLQESARVLLASPAALTDPASIPQMERSLAGAWREEATLTAELCDSAITPLDGEDIRSLASALTNILEALGEVHAAACRTAPAHAGWPLDSLCQATLAYTEAVSGLLPDPGQLASDPSRLAVLHSRGLGMRSARRACETALLSDAALDPCRMLAHLNLLEEFRRLRTCLNTTLAQIQRVVLKNS